MSTLNVMKHELMRERKMRFTRLICHRLSSFFHSCSLFFLVGRRITPLSSNSKPHLIYKTIKTISFFFLLTFQTKLKINKNRFYMKRKEREKRIILQVQSCSLSPSLISPTNLLTLDVEGCVVVEL